MYDAAFELIDSKDCAAWTPEETSDLLFLIANDNLDFIAERLGKTPTKLLALATAALTCSDPDAKWPLAVELGMLLEQKNEAESILFSFAYDENEYLRRRALLSLASLKSDKSEAIAERAWESGHLYQRIAALSVLNKISSAKLQEYLKKAHEDGREYLVKNALQIESAQLVAPANKPPAASVL